MAGTEPDRPGGPEKPAGRPRGPLDRSALTPEVVDWAEHLRELVDGAFVKDREAAHALRIDPPELSKFLSGRKAPERSFVRHVYAVCAERCGTAVDEQAVEHADVLYMRALKRLNPQVWELLTVLDERDAAVARERAARRDLSRVHGRLSRSDEEAERLRDELRSVRGERARLAKRVDGLLWQVRSLKEEAVVAEAIMIAERAAAEPEPLLGMDALIVRWSGLAIALSSLVGVAGVAVGLIGPPLAGDGSSWWQSGGWAVFTGAVLFGAVASWLRYEALKRLGAIWSDANAEPALALLLVLACAVPLVLMGFGIRSQQNYLDHRSSVSAEVSKCKEYRHYNSEGRYTGSSYKCTYAWTISGHTYEQRDWALKKDEGKNTTVLIDPADPSEMLPDRLLLRGYVHLYLYAFLGLLLPAGAVRLYRKARQDTAVEVRRARRRGVGATSERLSPVMWSRG
ncbi:hypothetical protein [Streptomyces sp. NPDC050263]|uniref:hypothetical protein n=1 Tax=Streptomyces sp. NPDC050263 TaxID=3155037 RepID=UPI0034140400